MAAPQLNINGFLRDKILAALVALGVYYLQNISMELAKLSQTLAVAASQISDHERRIEVLEQSRNENDREEARSRRN